MSLLVDSPAIQEVMHLVTGKFVPASTAIGDEEDKASQLRLDLRTLIEEKTPRYACAECGVPVYLVCRSEERRFHFRHLLEDNRCSAVTRGKLSQDEIDARKYNGAKESQLHRTTKDWVVRCLELDPGFSNIAVEKRWTGKLTGEWRKPDVQAMWRDKRIAFEIQLSTTHLNVIAARRRFYLKEGGLLLWIFSAFDDDNRRLTLDDVFYNNNQNAFVVNEKTVEASEKAGEFKLGCIFAEPHSFRITKPLQRRLVAFRQLTLDCAKQQAYFYDFYGHRDVFARSLREEFEAWFLSETPGIQNELPTWRRLQRRFSDVGISLPAWPSQLPKTLLNALYSTRAGRPIRGELKTFIQVAHNMTGGSRRPFLHVFRDALAAFDRANLILAEDKSGKWRDKVSEYKIAIREGDPAYTPDTTWDGLVEFLFPEIAEYRKSGKVASA